MSYHGKLVGQFQEWKEMNEVRTRIKAENKIPGVKECFGNPSGFPMPPGMTLKYALAMLLAQHTDATNAGEFLACVDRFPAYLRVLMVNFAAAEIRPRPHPEHIQYTREYAEWCSRNRDLIMGRRS